MRSGKQMKKRYYALLIMFVSCLWICGTKTSVCAADQIKTEPTDLLIAFDPLLCEFMEEDRASSFFVTKDCVIDLVYDNGLVSLSCDSITYMAEGYGVEAKVYYFEEAQFTSSSVYTPVTSYLYLDVIFQDKAKLGNDDKLWITLPAGLGMSYTEVRGRWAQPEAETEWIAVNDFVISIDEEMTNHVVVPLNQIVLGENGNRLLLSFHATSTDEAVTGVQKMRVTWQNNPVYNTVIPDAVVAPGFQKNDSWWKILLLTVVLILDVIVAVVVYLKLKRRPKNKDELTTQMIEFSEEEEYLKSIGYFEPKSNYKK